MGYTKGKLNISLDKNRNQAGSKVFSCVKSEVMEEAKKSSYCVADSGPDTWGHCAFPFKYKGQMFDGCITYPNKDKAWCSTWDEYKSGKWGNCPSYCRLALWRDDGRCGPNYPLRDGKPGQCDPDAEKGPCCSADGWCGKTGNCPEGYETA